MIFKKFCTICNCEYTDEKCPVCEQRLNAPVIKTDNNQTKKQKSKKNFKKISTDNDKILNKKIQELVDKYKKQL